MSRTALLGVLLSFCLFTCNSEREEYDGEPSYLFVQTAASGTFNDDVLVLKSASPSTLYFSDRPKRIAGHMVNPMFEELWQTGGEGFQADPPNATLSMFVDDQAYNYVVVLQDLVVSQDTLTYTVKVVEGDIPESFGPASLFIDGTELQGVALLYSLDTASAGKATSAILASPQEPL